MKQSLMKKPSKPRHIVKPGRAATLLGDSVRSDGGRFPIVGIGASAGGLEALEQFLSHVPQASGMAFIVVQHLDPTHKGMLPELLQRVTAMPVQQVKDGIKVRPSCVYVIPPNKDLSILRGKLYLLEPAASRGLRLPIDSFLRSLAMDQQERSVGVILSGMGTDGTLGLRAIKEKAGVVLVQEPASTQFESMPRSAIDAGLADLVAPAGELPGKLVAYLQHVPFISKTPSFLDEKMHSDLEKAIILLRAHTGHDFSLYRQITLHRRIERRMGIHQIGKTALYVRYLQENPQELDLLFKELLIGVTSFFRDPEAWEQLREQAIKPLLVSPAAGRTLRAWVSGCSTGEEAYSLAMVFKEALEQAKAKGRWALQIYATDLDRDAIDTARQGVFPENIAADVSPERLSRFFTKPEHGYRMSKEIREMVIFAPQNLIMDPPFTKLDILSCRNLLIYLTPELQKKLFPLFHYSLNPGGALFLGGAESIGSFTDLFAPLAAKARLFRRNESPLRAEGIEFPSSFVPVRAKGLELAPVAKSPDSLQALADQVVLQQCAPPTVLTNDQGDILYVSGRTGKYLEPAAGKANWNIFAMARVGLRHELTSAFHEALRERRAVVRRGVTVESNRGGQLVDVTVRALDEPAALRGMVMIVFAAAIPKIKIDDKAIPRAPNARIAQWKQELQRAREQVQSTREEMQRSQEELKSLNEELQSTNEELQSTNEELTTSKEEMQSLNEELQTVNAELQSKVHELSEANSDLKNLLNSTDIATMFLDNELRVRRFTTEASRIIKLIPGDVGRPITDLATDLSYPELAADAREVLRTLVFSEKPIDARDGAWFSVRIMPYRTVDDRIEGVVITFMDITAGRRREEDLREKNARLEKRVAGKSVNEEPVAERPAVVDVTGGTRRQSAVQMRGGPAKNRGIKP
jgi:two-component system CheB/CheR fusion protein